MSQGSLDPKIRFLGQKLWSVARVQRNRQTHTQTDTKVNTEGTLSGFQEFFLQPIIKDRPNIECLLCYREMKELMEKSKCLMTHFHKRNTMKLPSWFLSQPVFLCSSSHLGYLVGLYFFWNSPVVEHSWQKLLIACVSITSPVNDSITAQIPTFEVWPRVCQDPLYDTFKLKIPSAPIGGYSLTTTSSAVVMVWYEVDGSSSKSADEDGATKSVAGRFR